MPGALAAAEDNTDEPQSMADALEAAFNLAEAEESHDDDNSEPAGSDTGDVELGSVGEAGDDAQRSAAEGATAGGQPGEPQDQEPATPDGQEPPAEPAGADLETPPAGLPPAAREAWGDTPQAVKEAIAKREEDYSKGIQMYASGAQRAQQMDQALQPFQQFFAINGNNPPQVIRDVLGTAATLQMGSPQQKAAAAFQLIQSFGVDIGMLDQMLAGEAPAPGAAPAPQQVTPVDVQQAVQQALAQQQNEQSREAISSEIAAFAADPKNEFFNDVRNDIADIMDAAARHGQPMTLAKAYERACQLHPQISGILQARAADATNAQRRAAASSVSGSPSDSGTNAPPTTVRGILETAFDEGGRI